MSTFEFRMPSLGADMEAGTLVAWKVAPGASVRRGDVVAIVETDKGAIEIECWQAGRVLKLLVEPGAKVPVQTALATLEVDAEQARTPPRASPAARQLARERGIDLASAQVPGTGPGGAITRDDVEKAVAGTSPPPSPSPPRPAPERASPDIRRAIAAAMAKSKREIPHTYLALEIDMTAALAFLGRQNASRPVTERMLPAVLLLKAVALAARKFPELNGWWRNDAFEAAAGVHLGVAIAWRGGGLVAPALLDADRASLGDLSRRLADLIERTRKGGLRSSELSDGTITVTSLGEQGADVVFGVIYPPQVALVGFGKVAERPRAVGGLLGVRPTVTATLAADHRASDGHLGGRFLTHIDRLLQEPEKL